jgi:hypothetical protein
MGGGQALDGVPIANGLSLIDTVVASELASRPQSMTNSQRSIPIEHPSLDPVSAPSPARIAAVSLLLEFPKQHWERRIPYSQILFYRVQSVRNRASHLGWRRSMPYSFLRELTFQILPVVLPIVVVLLPFPKRAVPGFIAEVFGAREGMKDVPRTSLGAGTRCPPF